MWMWGDLQWGVEARAEHLRRLGNAMDERQGSTRALFDHMYENLTILDNKANTLMQYIAILFAVSSYNVATRPGSTPLLWAVIVFAVAAIILMFVIRIHWSKATDLDQLLRLRNLRTVGYRVSWLLALAATVLIVCHVLAAGA